MKSAFHVFGMFVLFALCSGTGMATLRVGNEAPAINATQWYNTAEKVDIYADTNAVYVVEFWATWCGPCRISIPHLNSLSKRLLERGVHFVSLSDEDPEIVEAFMKETPMAYPVGVGSNSGSAYNVEGIPTAFVVKAGRILWSGHPMQGLEMAIERALGDPFEPTAAAAVVGGSVVSKSDYESFVVAAMGETGLDDAPEVTKYRLLDFMVQRMILEDRLKAEGLTVTQAEILARYREEKEDFEGLPENKERSFETMLLENGVSVFLRHEMLRVDIGVSRLVEKTFVDAAVKEAYDAEPEKYQRVHVAHIMLRVRDWSASEDVKETRAKIEDLRSRIVAGADFADVARAHSEGRRSEKGGDWGWVGRGGETSIDQAMFTVAPGQLSDVLTTRVGFHFIKVLERKISFEQLQDDMRTEMLDDLKLEYLMKLTEGVDVRRNPYL